MERRLIPVEPRLIPLEARIIPVKANEARLSRCFAGNSNWTNHQMRHVTNAAAVSSKWVMNSQMTQVPTRLQNRAAAAPVYQSLSQLQSAANQTSLEKPLLELVKIRASQINRCAFCLELHTRVATAAGETAERLHLLPAWEEVENYSPRERAALRWTEALTALSDAAVSDDVFAEASAHLTEPELLELSHQIIAINSWNRLNVAFRIPPAPDYWPSGAKPTAETAGGPAQ